MTRLSVEKTKREGLINVLITHTFKNKERNMRFTDKNHNYIESDEERNEGHVDTRHNNFECDEPDPSLGCDMGIDVQG
jgi:hypothetical protein